MSAAMVDGTPSPDCNAGGLIREQIDAQRYDGQSDHPLEVGGRLHSMMPSGVRVLDVGCGTGSITLIANRNRSNNITCIEPDRDRASVARSRGLMVHCAFLDEAFIQEHGRFDVVMASDVLEHTPAPSEFLNTIIRAAKPGGTVLLSVPNVAHWSVRLSLLRGKFDYEPVGIMDATHLRWFTERSFRALIEHHDLTIKSFNQTAGFTLPVYERGLIRRIPRRVRNAVVASGARSLPRLFGCQHVVSARTQTSLDPAH